MNRRFVEVRVSLFDVIELSKMRSEDAEIIMRLNLKRAGFSSEYPIEESRDLLTGDYIYRQHQEDLLERRARHLLNATGNPELRNNSSSR